MKKIALIILVIIAFIIAKPALWIQAEEMCKKQTHFPEQLTIGEVVSSKSGKIIEQSKIIVKQSLNKNYSFVSATENSKVVIKKSDICELTKIIAETTAEEFYGAEVNPFLGEVSDIVEVRSINSQRKNTISYSYVQKTVDGIWKGILYIDEKSGQPLWLRAQFQNIPFTKDGVKINRLDLKSCFISIHGTIVVSSVLYTSGISIKEGILPTFHGDIKNSIDFTSFKSTENSGVFK